jgi:hypothetical protein
VYAEPHQVWEVLVSVSESRKVWLVVEEYENVGDETRGLLLAYQGCQVVVLTEVVVRVFPGKRGQSVCMNTRAW